MRLLFLAVLAVPNLAFAQGYITDAQTGCKLALKGSGPPSSTLSVSWDGPCVKGFMHGRGVLRHFDSGKPSGVYEGVLVAGWATGRGVWTSTSGYRYEGVWRRGDRHGQGTATWSDGTRFVGSWRNDLPNGIGTATAANGTAYSGNWTNGCFRQGGRQAYLGTTKEKCGFK